MKNTKAAKESIISRAEKYSIKLTAIASIKPGHQWNTNCGAPQRPGIMTSISRTVWYSNESRDLNLADIRECLDGSFRILTDIEDVMRSTDITPEDTLTYDAIVSDLKSGLLNAKDGISNLKVTYHDDESVNKQLKGLIKSIKDRYIASESPKLSAKRQEKHNAADDVSL